MRAGIIVEVTPQDRDRLDRIIGDRNSPQKHAARARVILATGEGCGTTEIMRRSGLSKPVVWRWQERFMREGVDGLLRDKTRPPGKPPMAAGIVKRIVGLTYKERRESVPLSGTLKAGQKCTGPARPSRCRKPAWRGRKDVHSGTLCQG